MSQQFEKRYAQLNSAQKQAVDTIDGPVLVIAGPGSGKTELLTLRIANILKIADVYPGNILCLTFTEAAAGNMRERLRGLIGEAGNKVAIHTFHSFGSEIIATYPEYFFQGATFTAADDLAQVQLLETLLAKLPFNNPLRSEHPEEGFIYIQPLKSALSQLKRGGLTPDEFQELLEANALAFPAINQQLHILFDGRVSTSQFSAIDSFVKALINYPQDLEAAREPLALYVARSLASALQEAEITHKAAALSEWKSTNLSKTLTGERVLKDFLHLESLRTVAEIYRDYQTGLYERRLFDFDDMLLRVIQATESEPSLAAELQERYQYVLVDEFQDTNDAQLRLLSALLNNPVNEGQPNVLAVGDDDQAIYKFQGAELANILQFRQRYVQPTIITLTANYRSTQNILDLASGVIRQAHERLENLLPDVDKQLVAMGTDQEGQLAYPRFDTKEQQYVWITQEIEHLQTQGIPLGQIAVICRHHKELQTLLPYLQQAHLPVRYERQQDIMLEPHIRQLVIMARFVVTLGRHQQLEADYLLPELLSYPCWELPRQALWELGVAAYAQKRLWLDLMRERSEFARIAEFLTDLASRSLHEPLEEIISALIGADPHVVPDNEDEELENESSQVDFFSPYKRYYFGSECFRTNKFQYLTFLSSLRTLVQRLRDYRTGESLQLEDLLTFVDTHLRNHIPVLDTSEIATGTAAVQLLTAHKAKGLEFETVFITSCTDQVWAGRGHSSLIRFPLNLPLAPGHDAIDDQLRLFYVALSRAKRRLYLTSYISDEKGRLASALQFLPPTIWQSLPQTKPISTLTATISSWAHKPIEQEERSLLINQLEHYVLNATHINNFLDVVHAGPHTFLEQNLLRFPQPKSVSGAFGSAIHAALHQVSLHVRQQGSLPNESELLGWFEQQLFSQRLSNEQFNIQLERGCKALQAFFAARAQEFVIAGESERDFRSQNVRIANVPVTGKIDRIIKNGNQLTVYDYKTGKPARDWQGRNGEEKIKLWNYRRQLTFYKLLIENSRDYKGQEVVLGRLEFVEPERGTGQLLQLDLLIDKAETERLQALIMAVHAKIMQLDFPKTSHYSQDISGIETFENDLLNGNI